MHTIWTKDERGNSTLVDVYGPPLTHLEITRGEVWCASQATDYDGNHEVMPIGTPMHMIGCRECLRELVTYAADAVSILQESQS